MKSLIRTKYLRIDQYGLFIWKYRFSTSKFLWEDYLKRPTYKHTKLPFGIDLYYL